MLRIIPVLLLVLLGDIGKVQAATPARRNFNPKAWAPPQTATTVYFPFPWSSSPTETAKSNVPAPIPIDFENLSANLRSEKLHRSEVSARSVILPNGKPLFGGVTGWRISVWKAIDDSVRGGVSSSTLKLSPPVDGTRINPALFSGSVDFAKLNGAGFASQRFNAPTWFDLSSKSGIQLAVDAKRSDTKVYDFNLYDQEPDETGTSIEWKYAINLSDPAVKGKKEIQIRWEDFKPFYRGQEMIPRPKDQVAKNKILAISLMCRSNFAKQSGNFNLTVNEITTF